MPSEVIVMNFTDQDSVGVFLDEIDSTIEVAITVDLHRMIVVEGLYNVAGPVLIRFG